MKEHDWGVLGAVDPVVEVDRPLSSIPRLAMRAEGLIDQGEGVPEIGRSVRAEVPGHGLGSDDEALEAVAQPGCRRNPR